MSQLVELQVFLASPGDVQSERDRARAVIAELDRGVARRLGFALRAVGWETDTRPGLGDDVQAVINEQIRPRNVFVGIMWSRLGTPTERTESGTVEEFEYALELHRQERPIEVMFYFCMRAVQPMAGLQIEEVMSFKEAIKQEGVYSRDFTEVDEFGDLLRTHLTEFLFTWSESGAISPGVGVHMEGRGRGTLMQFAAESERAARDALNRAALLASVVGQLERRSALPDMVGWPAEDQCAVFDRTIHSLRIPLEHLVTSAADFRDCLNELDASLGLLFGEVGRLGRTGGDDTTYLRESVAELTGRVRDVRSRLDNQKQDWEDRAQVQTRAWVALVAKLAEPISLVGTALELTNTWIPPSLDDRLGDH